MYSFSKLFPFLSPIALIVIDLYFFNQPPPSKEVVWWGPLKEAKLLLITLFRFLILFLVFDISPDFFLIKTNCYYTITPTPEMVSPILFILQDWKSLKHADRCLPSYYDLLTAQPSGHDHRQRRWVSELN